MKLNYKISSNGQPIIFLHGLFGNLDNLAILAREFAPYYQTIQIDLRNHGLSPWADDMDYQLMAHDVLALINQLGLKDIILVGHSMGGKVAMQLAKEAENLIAQVIILDIAPVTYYDDSHSKVFKAINAGLAVQAHDKAALNSIMSQYLNEATVQFLLKSYKSNKWLFNFKAIEQHYTDIRSWKEITPYRQPVLFIKGAQSDYIIEGYYSDILMQFPYAKIEGIEGAGHNVHFDKPKQVITLIKNWLT
ncbi:alpha/beta fold hydrolase [Orbus sturtevantii]|uniref:alpha/beta fold hydrolase n=1 Tax=Orbus sturtevantii TaxID=3074109 RepID=UPI00370D9E20